ncbi:hypothetical protein KR49_01430 [Synechococcus sp. KORDI-49]|jgi:hypothetical protein|uniref:hypothetical protein n=1 Tax=Synechococcales TaxID=1890424 RepID=UPI0004E051B5|nr:hypothetical protein [Synechococcus sp. KORDI-49]AII45126.1 hypothetical protein KR49_01430 [Synechococcus sp. KORDI-49]|tara:strand:+ start:367 stop:540 length:174 start_codon:yes stop_codon:yes gene_type:complete
MTSCPWPRRTGWLDRLHDWWTPPERILRSSAPVAVAEQDQTRQELWETLMRGGIWLS